MPLRVFADKILLVTGGTGSFGSAVVERFLKSPVAEIRVFSRDEKKQDDMRKLHQDERLKFYIGDVRDPGSLRDAMRRVDFVFHAAALKQVPSCEFFPLEAVKTNILGTDNVLTAAIEAGVARAVCLSTDKAAYPINAMGTSKAMAEKVILAKARNAEKTIICCTRYGNVMCSRGSVIPLFIEQIKANQAVTVTEPGMSRFMMTMDEAVALVLFAFSEGRSGDLFIRKSPSAIIGDLALVLNELFGSDLPPCRIGFRHGEKLYETIATIEELVRAEDLGEYLRIPADSRSLNYEKYMETGTPEMNSLEPLTSHNSRRLGRGELRALLLSLAYVRREIGGMGLITGGA